MKRRRTKLSIVPRLLKSAVHISVIPACAFSAASCAPPRPPPVVAAMGDPREDYPEPEPASTVAVDASSATRTDVVDAAADAARDAAADAARDATPDANTRRKK
ncbi:MAG: hypothetical protein JWM74_1285 [Myxococcaceae bacterium]|nr:hypothetical protein [Myxococcaceae bacterium]